MATVAEVTHPNLGGVAPGWTSDIQASPLVIGDSPPTTGVASFTSQTVVDSEFTINDSNQVTRPGLGSLTGDIDTLGLTDLRTNVTQGTPLTRLNADVPKGILLGGTKRLQQHFREAIGSILPIVTVTWKSAVDPVKSYPYWRGNVWANLNEMCAASGHELVINNDVIEIWQIGSRTQEFPAFAESGMPQIKIDSKASSEVIEIINQNATQVDNLEIYSASDDGNAMYQVGARDTVYYKVMTNSYPSELVQPSAVTRVWPNLTVSTGTYAVSAADGRAVPADIWTAFGGRVRVAVDADVPNMLVITLTGPQWLIPGFEAPYRLSVSDSVTDYAALSIRGTGIKTAPETITLYTGANPLRVTGNSVPKVESTFVESLATTYDRGVWAADEAAGPNVTFSATVPVQDVTGFGVSVGSIFTYGQQNWRITSSSTTNEAVQIDATRYVTCGVTDKLWEGSTAAQNAAFWAGHPVEDVTIRPLRK